MLAQISAFGTGATGILGAICTLAVGLYLFYWGWNKIMWIVEDGRLSRQKALIDDLESRAWAKYERTHKT